jgi:hypothetical protein
MILAITAKRPLFFTDAENWLTSYSQPSVRSLLSVAPLHPVGEAAVVAVRSRFTTSCPQSNYHSIVHHLDQSMHTSISYMYFEIEDWSDRKDPKYKAQYDHYILSNIEKK